MRNGRQLLQGMTLFAVGFARVVPQAACNGVTHNNETGAKFLSRP